MLIEKEIKKLALLVLLCFSLVNGAFAHDLKRTASMFEYNITTKLTTITCNVFIDDFQYSIGKETSNTVNVYQLHDSDRVAIDEYFNEHIKVRINNKVHHLKFERSEILNASNVFSVTFNIQDFKFKKGDQLQVQNTLLYKEFGNRQTNLVAFDLPPFLHEMLYEFSSKDKSFNLTL